MSVTARNLTNLLLPDSELRIYFLQELRQARLAAQKVVSWFSVNRNFGFDELVTESDRVDRSWPLYMRVMKALRVPLPCSGFQAVWVA